MISWSKSRGSWSVMLRTAQNGWMGKSWKKRVWRQNERGMCCRPSFRTEWTDFWRANRDEPASRIARLRSQRMRLRLIRVRGSNIDKTGLNVRRVCWKRVKGLETRKWTQTKGIWKRERLSHTWTASLFSPIVQRQTSPLWTNENRFVIDSIDLKSIAFTRCRFPVWVNTKFDDFIVNEPKTAMISVPTHSESNFLWPIKRNFFGKKSEKEIKFTLRRTNGWMKKFLVCRFQNVTHQTFHFHRTEAELFFADDHGGLDTHHHQFHPFLSSFEICLQLNWRQKWRGQGVLGPDERIWAVKCNGKVFW